MRINNDACKQNSIMFSSIEYVLSFGGNDECYPMLIRQQKSNTLV